MVSHFWIAAVTSIVWLHNLSGYFSLHYTTQWGVQKSVRDTQDPTTFEWVFEANAKDSVLGVDLAKLYRKWELGDARECNTMQWPTQHFSNSIFNTVLALECVWHGLVFIILRNCRNFLRWLLTLPGNKTASADGIIRHTGFVTWCWRWSPILVNANSLPSST